MRAHAAHCQADAPSENEPSTGSPGNLVWNLASGMHMESSGKFCCHRDESGCPVVLCTE